MIILQTLHSDLCLASMKIFDNDGGWFKGEKERESLISSEWKKSIFTHRILQFSGVMSCNEQIEFQLEKRALSVFYWV